MPGSIVIKKNRDVPIGSVIAWCKDMTGAPSLPKGWQECNGGAITQGPMSGQSVPNLNSQQRFLRGGTTSGVFGGSSSHGHTLSFATETVYYMSWGDLSVNVVKDLSNYTSWETTLPPSYYQVVFIMRIF